jgi:hypothetical protein
MTEQWRFADVDRVKQEFPCGLLTPLGLEVEPSDNLATNCPKIVEMAFDRLG